MLDKIKNVVKTIWTEYETHTSDYPKFIQYTYLGIMVMIVILTIMVLYDLSVLLGGLVIFGSPLVALWMNYREIRRIDENKKSLRNCMLFTTATAVAWLVLLLV